MRCSAVALGRPGEPCIRFMNIFSRQTFVSLVALAFTLGISGCRGHESSAQAPASGPAAPAPSGTTARLVEMLEAFRKEQPVAGLDVVVWHHGKATDHVHVGEMDNASHAPVREDTVFRIGSITKTYTAALVLRLVDKGMLDLSAPITRYVPDYKSSGAVPTVAQLLLHTAGVPDYVPELESQPVELEQKDLTHQELLGIILKKQAPFAAGESWAYSNSNYYLLGMAVEAVTRKTYVAALRDEILQPLGLEHTTACAELHAGPTLASGYAQQDGKLVPAQPLSLRNPFAAGALCATAQDVARFQHAFTQGNVVSSASLTAAMHPHPLSNGIPLGYGFGVGLGDVDGQSFVGHAGGIRGFTSHALHFPASQTTVVVLCNTEAQGIDMLARRIARLYLPTENMSTPPAATTTSLAGRYLLVIGVPMVITAASEDRINVPMGKKVAELSRVGGNRFCTTQGCDAMQITFDVTTTPPSFMLQKQGLSLGAVKQDVPQDASR